VRTAAQLLAEMELPPNANSRDHQPTPTLHYRELMDVATGKPLLTAP